MEITDLINKELPGSLFNLFNYDQSMEIKKLKQEGYPYSLAYFDVNEETIIAIGDADFDKSPVEIIEESKSFSFKLSASIHPKQAKTMYGLKTILYVEKIVPPKENNITKSSDKYYENNLSIRAMDDGRAFQECNFTPDGDLLDDYVNYIFVLKEGARYIDNYKSWRSGYAILNKNEFLEVENKLQVNKPFPIPGKLIVKDSLEPWTKNYAHKLDILGKPILYKSKYIYRTTHFSPDIDDQDVYLNEVRDTFVFNIFKVDEKVFFYPERCSMTHMDYLKAIEVMRKKKYRMRSFLGDPEQKKLYEYRNLSTGSVQITVDFLKNEPHHNCTVKTKGFFHHDIEDVIRQVWKSEGFI